MGYGGVKAVECGSHCTEGDVGHVGCEGLAADIAGDLGEDTVTVVVVLGSLTRPLRSVHLRLSNRLNNDNM